MPVTLVEAVDHFHRYRSLSRSRAASEDAHRLRICGSRCSPAFEIGEECGTSSGEERAVLPVEIGAKPWICMYESAQRDLISWRWKSQLGS